MLDETKINSIIEYVKEEHPYFINKRTGEIEVTKGLINTVRDNYGYWEWLIRKNPEKNLITLCEEYCLDKRSVASYIEEKQRRCTVTYNTRSTWQVYDPFTAV